MDIDVFTLFPQWFDWFREQRHVRNVLDTGSSITCVNPREFTPLTGRQVDDTPFGGRAGMMLRKLPGALGHEESAAEESFSAALGGNPEYPHYTRPAEYRGWKVPEVLLSGHHAMVRQWRRAASVERGRGEGEALP